MQEALKDKNISKVKETAQKWLRHQNRMTSDEIIEQFKFELLSFLGYNNLEADLKVIEQDHPLWFFPSFQLSELYLGISTFGKAKEYAEKSISKSNNSDRLQKALINYSEILEKSNSEEEAISYLEKNVIDESLKEDAAPLYQKIAELKERKDDIIGKHYNLEKALQLDPTNKEIMFNLAESYSEREGQQFQSILNYKKILALNPNHIPALNNIAYVYGNLNLKYEKNNYLIKAINLGATDVKGNMLSELIRMGFYEVAQKIYDDLSADDKNNERVIEAIRNLHRKIEEGKQKHKVLLDAEKIYNKYYEKYNSGKVQSLSLGQLKGKWIENNSITLHLEPIEEGKISGVYEESPGQKIEPIEGMLSYNKLTITIEIPRNYGLLKSPSYETWTYDLFAYDTQGLIGIKWCDPLFPKEVALIKE